MATSSSSSNILKLIFPFIAISVLGIATILAYFSVGIQTFFQSLGWLGWFGLITLALIMAIAINKHSSVVSVIFSTIALLFFVLLTILMFLVAHTTSRVVIFELKQAKQLNEARVSKMIEALEGKKTIVMFATKSVFLDAFQSNEAMTSTLEARNVFFKDKIYIDELTIIFGNLGFERASVDGFKVPPDRTIKEAYDLLKTYKVCKAILKNSEGCFICVFFKDDSENGIIPDIN